MSIKNFIKLMVNLLCWWGIVKYVFVLIIVSLMINFAILYTIFWEFLRKDYGIIIQQNIFSAFILIQFAVFIMISWAISLWVCKQLGVYEILIGKKEVFKNA